MKKNNKKGFTLAELLIVVAIIAVLVAVAIPVFTTQLEKSRDATSIANIRSAYAQAMTEYLTGTSAGAASTSVTVPSVLIQTAQANSWSGEGANLPFSAPSDPGNKTSKSYMSATFTFSTGSDATTSVTCAIND